MKKFKADEILLIVKFHRLFSLEMGFVPAPFLTISQPYLENNFYFYECEVVKDISHHFTLIF